MTDKNPTRQVSRRDTRITQRIKFNPSTYQALNDIKQAVEKQAGVVYSNSVICRALILEFRRSLISEPELLRRLANRTAHNASQVKHQARQEDA